MNRLYRCIGFDAALEAKALSSLADLDVEQCRACLVRLVSSLDFSGLEDEGREGVLLILDLLLKVNRRVHRPNSDPESYHACRAQLVEKFARLTTAGQARDAFTSVLNSLLASLVRGRGCSHPLIARAKAYIEQHYHERISLSSVATLVHLSPNYLSRLFRRETGMTLTEYTHKLRLEHARLLLAEGERSISEIAYVVGYQNYRDFYRNFVKYENASPREVQRRLQPPASS